MEYLNKTKKKKKIYTFIKHLLTKKKPFLSLLTKMIQKWLSKPENQSEVCLTQ